MVCVADFPRSRCDYLKPLIDDSLSEAWSNASPTAPLPGTVTSKRIYRSERLITATGSGWSPSRTGGPAILLHDHVPCTGLDIARDPPLCRLF